MVCDLPTSDAGNNGITAVLEYEEIFADTAMPYLEDELFLNAMETAFEIRPNYRLCEDLTGIYFFEDFKPAISIF